MLARATEFFPLTAPAMTPSIIKPHAAGAANLTRPLHRTSKSSRHNASNGCRPLDLRLSQKAISTTEMPSASETTTFLKQSERLSGRLGPRGCAFPAKA